MNQTYEIKLDTDKALDEAIYYALAGLHHCRNVSLITGIARLEMAMEKLDKEIKRIRQKIDEKAKENKNEKSRE